MRMFQFFGGKSCYRKRCFFWRAFSLLSSAVVRYNIPGVFLNFMNEMTSFVCLENGNVHKYTQRSTHTRAQTPARTMKWKISRCKRKISMQAMRISHWCMRCGCFDSGKCKGITLVRKWKCPYRPWSTNCCVTCERMMREQAKKINSTSSKYILDVCTVHEWAANARNKSYVFQHPESFDGVFAFWTQIVERQEHVFVNEWMNEWRSCRRTIIFILTYSNKSILIVNGTTSTANIKLKLKTLHSGKCTVFQSTRYCPIYFSHEIHLIWFWIRFKSTKVMRPAVFCHSIA